MARVDHRDALGKLKFGIALSWLLNFLILTATIEAAIVLTFLSSESTNVEIGSFLLYTSVVAAIISAIAMTIASAFSYRSIKMGMPDATAANPGHHQALLNIVEEMCIAARIPRKHFPEVVIIASDDPNAFALSSARGSMVGVTTALLKILNREELQAVIGHEIGHIYAGDTKAMTKLIAMSSIVGIVSGVFGRIFFGGRRGGNNNNPLALVVMLLSFIFLLVAPLISAAANALMQRNRESQADALAVQFTRNPSAMASALRKIEYHSKEGSDIQKKAKQMAFFSRAHYRTHPPTEQRIQALRDMGADPSI